MIFPNHGVPHGKGPDALEYLTDDPREVGDSPVAGRGYDVNFGTHQTSDGMSRVMALLALLLQPEADLPSVVILDEPELGLHPDAINVIAGLLQSVSTHTQVILATQWMTLVDYFVPEQIVVDRVDRESKFR